MYIAGVTITPIAVAAVRSTAGSLRAVSISGANLGNQGYRDRGKRRGGGGGGGGGGGVERGY